MVPLTVIPIIVFGRQVKALSREAQARMGEMVSEGAETLDGVRTVQAFAQEDRAALRFGEATERSFVAATRRVSRRAIMTTLVIFIVFSAVGFLLWMGGHDVLTGRITAGDLSAFVFYAVLVASSGGAISETIGDLQRASGAAERLAELRAEPPSIAEPANPKPLPRPVQGAVSFENVSFRYPTRTDSLALDRFDLDVKPGETVAIVGPSGAGKTTAFNLLLRFYDPEQGTIRLDGIDIRQLALRDLRRALATVPQDPTLFSTSVAENIRYGRPEASDAQVRAAAEAASALSFIEALPQGFATDLGARGVRLSGGQRQRIAIARALLCDPARPAARRGDQRPRRGKRTGGPAGVGQADAGTYDAGDRPSAGDGAEGGPYPRDRPGTGRRCRQARRPGAPRRSLRPVGRTAVQRASRRQLRNHLRYGIILFENSILEKYS